MTKKRKHVPAGHAAHARCGGYTAPHPKTVEISQERKCSTAAVRETRQKKSGAQIQKGGAQQSTRGAEALPTRAHTMRPLPQDRHRCGHYRHRDAGGHTADEAQLRAESSARPNMRRQASGKENEASETCRRPAHKTHA